MHSLIWIDGVQLVAEAIGVDETIGNRYKNIKVQNTWFLIFKKKLQGNFPWSEDNLNGTKVYVYKNETSPGVFAQFGMLQDFKHYMKEANYSSIVYDWAATITG